ncbi:hypothetical protein ACFE04_014284 [Oxalis oulophora]
MNKETNNNNMILQDFLATPPTTNTTTTTTTNTSDPSSVLDSTFSGPLTPPPPATLLSLNTGSNSFHQFHMRHSHNNNIHPPPLPLVHLHSSLMSTSSYGSPLNHSFVDSLVGNSSSSSIFPSFCKKRGQENEEKPVDRRHKRVIKNRESAARSRARKQAYMHELELEVAHLQEENAKLRKLQERVLAVCEQIPKKHTLTRSLTSPF